MLEKCLSFFFHLIGIHKWHQQKFVNLFHELVGPHDFEEDRIYNVWMKNILSCDHGLILNENFVDPQSLEYKLLLNELCSNLFIDQLEHSVRFFLSSRESMILNYTPKRYNL